MSFTLDARRVMRGVRWPPLAAMGSVTIKSSTGSHELQLSEEEGLLRLDGSEYYRASLKAEGLTASAKVYAYEPHGELSQFFAELAAHREGWEGEKRWRSLEGELTLSCRSGGGSRITIEVVLRSGLYEDDWCVQAMINIEAGQLVSIAANVRQFFSSKAIT